MQEQVTSTPAKDEELLWLLLQVCDMLLLHALSLLIYKLQHHDGILFHYHC